MIYVRYGEANPLGFRPFLAELSDEAAHENFGLAPEGVVHWAFPSGCTEVPAFIPDPSPGGVGELLNWATGQENMKWTPVGPRWPLIGPPNAEAQAAADAKYHGTGRAPVPLTVGAADTFHRRDQSELKKILEEVAPGQTEYTTREDGTGVLRIKDSGRRQEFDTGSRRDSRTGKGRYDLLPARALRRVARVFESGAAKYGDRNWEKGQPLSRYLDSALRHTYQVLEGKTDEDHAAQACWNLLAFLETQERIRAGLLPATLDDLPPGQE